jgi:hypothetical protein
MLTRIVCSPLKVHSQGADLQVVYATKMSDGSSKLRSALDAVLAGLFPCSAELHWRSQEG